MTEKHQNLVLWRLAVVLLVMGLLALGIWLLINQGPASIPIRCHFHEWTGLHCAGCGMTRATYALFQGRLLDAIGQNPFGIIIMPLALIGFGLETIGWLQKRQPPWRIPLGYHGAKIIALSFIAFMILRNLPWVPFSYLAPH